LGVHGRTVVRLIENGKLSARRLASGQFRLNRSEVEAYGAAQAYVPDSQQSEEDRPQPKAS